ARFPTLTHHAARSPTCSWSTTRAIASAAYSSASSRLPDHAARARTTRGQAALNSSSVGRTDPWSQWSSGDSLHREDLAPLDGAAGRDKGGHLAGHGLVLDLHGVEAGDQLAGVGVGAVGVDGGIDLPVTLAGRQHPA